MSNPFRLNLQSQLLAKGVGRLLGLESLANYYDARPPGLTTPQFLQHSLEVLGVTVELTNAENCTSIPRQGPLLIVANHPLGGLEGIALAHLLLSIRPDLKVLTNQLLRRVPELRDLFIGVDVLSTDARRDNVAGIKQVHSHLKQGGALLIFPAGVVSTYEFKHRAIVDKSWNRLVGSLVKRFHCPCLPVYVDGRNSWYFYLAGFIHKRLRTVLLPRQLSNKQGYTLRLAVGRTIHGHELASIEEPQAVTEYLRISTEALGAKAPVNKRQELPTTAEGAQTQGVAELIGNLQDCKLVEHADFAVYCAPYQRLGAIMEQIALARELTFRSVGEGTGLASDSDRFDRHYLHLFLWDKHRGQVAGAYRIGKVDAIVHEHGVKGLYTRSLYRYKRAFIEQLGPALELGRSFVHPDYQRRPAALNLLWRGIGAFLVRNPNYPTLFGSVSISREYTDLARSLIADAMLNNYGAAEFSNLVTPITPLKIRNRVWSVETLRALANIKILSKLVGRCNTGKAVPVLLRHYLSLNGRLVCFNIHSGFNDSLEGLIIVDMRACDSKTAIRFMGEAGYNQFMDVHKLQHTA